MHEFTVVLSIVAIIFTALPIFKAAFWWIRIFDYPRTQIALLCMVCIALNFYYVGLQSPFAIILFVLLIISLIYQSVLILKYTPLYPVQAKKFKEGDHKSPIKILQVNVKMDNKEVDKFLKLVEEINPDIVVLTEPNKWWGKKVEKLEKQFQYSIKKPLENTYGMIMYSKFLLKRQEINFLVDKEIPSFYAKVIIKDHLYFDIHTVHPKPPKPGTPTYDRDTEILIVGKRIREADQPAMVVGDLNDVAWSYTSGLFQRYSRLLDPREGRGLYNTYNAFIPLFRYPLDHFFYSKHFSFINLKRLKPIGSDHFPMLLEVSLQPDKSHKNHVPESDKGDKKEVKKIIKQERI